MPRAYRSFSGSLIDPEKQYLAYDDESDSGRSLNSSRSTSASHTPMLREQLSSSMHNVAWSRRFPQRRFTRYFTLAISSSLILFIFFLVKASWVSQAEVQNGVTQLADPTPEWERFPVLKRYFGGIRTLVDRTANEVEYPLSEDQEASRLEKIAMERKLNDEIKSNNKRDAWQSRAIPFDPFAEPDANKPVSCAGMAANSTHIPQLLSYRGVPSGFPNPVMGSYNVLGMRDDVCFDRFGRLGPYGYGYSKGYGGISAGMDGDTIGKEDVWRDGLEVDYRVVNWADAQEDCLSANAHRFKTFHRTTEPDRWLNMAKRDEDASKTTEANKTTDVETSSQNQGTPTSSPSPAPIQENRLLPRTAVLIRTWDSYKYDEEDILNLRALINELSLESGGEYEVHFLVHLKNESQQVFADEQTYQDVLNAALPEEFQGMGTLWSEQQMALIYSGLKEINYYNLPVHGVYRSTFMPVQYFAHKHPEYDFIWNWEMDIRYTGHFYHLFDRASKWSREQPRKGALGENADSTVQIEHGTASKTSMYAKLPGLDPSSNRMETPVWGPQPPTQDILDGSHDPVPPTTYERDDYHWGVGEDADLISFNPFFDPQGTTWGLAGDVTGYNSTIEDIPRRAAIGTGARLSRRLLDTMHRETAIDLRTMTSEMWPATCAFHHGFKAVYVPHPVYVDRAWPPSYLAAVMNNGKNGASGGAHTSVFGDRKQHNFKGTTWFYDALFGAKLWQRWLGYKVEEDGGEEFEVMNEGRMCLPAMLLHPVKEVELIIERAKETVQESFE
ncbi:hypothetical protein AMS68_002395 [Peltaster fructicola]|uniref:Uncharacterized protein n=1 Tax=Peltaster fructicola TaxID=286661 RepID=A0A6H0XQG1_9PEZI|nr:hypothetical protein AMS68_002395 [Peltaster fructicola]